MTDDDDELPEQFVTQRTADATCYHTRCCVGVARSDRDPTPIADRTIEWHDLPLCRYCDPDIAVENQRGGVADD